MKHACCQWCNRFIQVEDHYNPQIHRRYCSIQCFMAEDMFERWQEFDYRGPEGGRDG